MPLRLSDLLKPTSHPVDKWVVASFMLEDTLEEHRKKIIRDRKATNHPSEENYLIPEINLSHKLSKQFLMKRIKGKRWAYSYRIYRKVYRGEELWMFSVLKDRKNHSPESSYSQWEEFEDFLQQVRRRFPPHRFDQWYNAQFEQVREEVFLAIQILRSDPSFRKYLL